MEAQPDPGNACAPVWVVPTQAGGALGDWKHPGWDGGTRRPQGPFGTVNPGESELEPSGRMGRGGSKQEAHAF